MNILSVDALNEQIKNLLETTFIRNFVEGELSRVTYHNSGHIYFTLKDANASISCVMFKGNASRLKFRLEEGLKLVLEAAITVYKPRGQYQLNVLSAEPSGKGALALAFEQLKSKLQSQGYFAPEHKKELPKYVMSLGLITSETGAALQDMLRVAQVRWPLLKIALYDAVVQGESAPKSIARGIKQADKNNHDVIVIGRGGGSMEDLWGFNEELVANCIYHCKTPIVSAVGHEIDWVISDYVADLRAPTPSAAMEMILPDKNEILMNIDNLMQELNRSQSQRLLRASDQLKHLFQAYAQNSIENRLKMKIDEVKQMKSLFNQKMAYVLDSAKREISPLKQMLPRQMQIVLQTKKSELKQLESAFVLQDPSLKSKKGFAQISIDGKLISLETLKLGDVFEAMSDTLTLTNEVKSIKENT
ncbi:exodeoxyribonuclease VII large subunit [Sulfurimonas sp. MAG313]|nr:exodeoxyribonuclease VII large subunit [Sulfurimonas sp. MAG313]MDF1881003.1 exodeoxyribonuclease VII large subunit [Sulfurimonas sp. MAG313]